MDQSTLAHITNCPAEPVAFFKQLLQDVAQRHPAALTYMNLATVDEEFGVLNRTVVYRGLSEDNCIIYITQRFTRNYQNLKANAKCGITFLMPDVVLPSQDPQPATWQIRLLGATAVELPESQLDAWWSKELLSSQIRNLIFPCGQPVDYNELKAKHDKFLKEHLASGTPLTRPSTYTAFKFHAQRWDFLKVGSNQIADRVQYRRQDDGQWQKMHVST